MQTGLSLYHFGYSLTSLADALLARHTIFPPNVGEELLRDEPKQRLRRRLDISRRREQRSDIRLPSQAY